jgi:hypothetical protein
MKILLTPACLSLLVFAAVGSVSTQPQKSDKSSQAAAPNSGSDQVEVNTDRSSGKTTIKLKPQLILDTPDQFITMWMEAKFGDKKIRSEIDQTVEILSESAMIWFESQAKRPTDFGDQELNFIIDGNRLALGRSSGGLSRTPGRDPNLKPDFKILERFANSLNTDQLKQVARGKHIEMRLGKYEFALSPTAHENIREFVREFYKYAPSSKLKGGRQ